MEKKFDPQHLNVVAFAREGGVLAGRSPLSVMSRLSDEQVPGDWPADDVVWRLQGRLVSVSGGGDQVWLDVQASVDLTLQCQRCLTPVRETVQAERAFRFVADEASAAALDDEVEEDLLVISRDFDALALVEDELIMSLPLVPLHELCPQAVPLSAVDADFESAAQRPHAFSVLAALKTGKS